jgi:hypothetical protein
MADEQKIEVPVVEEPVKETEPVATPEIDIDGLVAELEQAGIKNPEQLQGKLQASQQTGRLENMLGEVNRENKKLRESIEALQTKPQVQDQNYEYTEGQPVDIALAIEQGVDRALGKREKAANDRQQALLKSMSDIQADEDYATMKPIWEEKLKDPDFVFKVNNGVVDPVRAYQETVRQYYKGMMKRAASTINTLKDGVKIDAPHVETQQTSTSQLPAKEPTEQEEKLNKLKEKASKGVLTTNEEMDALDAVLA